MARADKRATVREEVSLAEQRPVQLQANKRFFSSQGQDKAVREARALSQAFETGTQFFSEEIDRRNIKGGERALGARAAGQARDVEDKNQGYNKAWDELDAEADVNFMKQELPEMLRGADWENLEEHQVSELVSNYMKEQYEGVDPTSWYGQKLAPALLAIEAETLATHRDMVVGRIQEEQRTNIFSNLEARFKTSRLDPETPQGVFDYEYLGEQTNIFFDGPMKREVYWKSIYEFAIDNGRPDIILGAPKRFKDGKGDPTGIDDPLQQEAHRKAVNQAINQRKRISEAQGEENEIAFNTEALAHVVAVNEGVMPTSDMITNIAAMPGAQATVVAALAKTLVTINNNVDSQSADSSVVASLTESIIADDLPNAISVVSQAYSDGKLGEGDFGVNQFQELLGLIGQNDRIYRTGANEEFKFLDQDIDARYPIQRGPTGFILNPGMAEINRQAHLEYRNAKIKGGDDFDEYGTWADITERFDARRDRLAPVAPPEPRKTEFVVEDFLLNKATTQELQLTGITPKQIGEMEALTEQQKIKLLTGLKTPL